MSDIKLCRKCNCNKPLSEFGRRFDRGPNSVRSECHSCSSRRKRGWEAENPDKHKAISQASQVKWREANADLARARVLVSKRKKADYYRQQGAQWQADNPAKCRAKYKRYMAVKAGAFPSWADDWLIEEAYELAQLRTRVTGFAWHVDHIVPLQSPLVCGLHVIDNLQVIPATVNLSKSNRYWLDMPGQRN